MSQPLSFYIDFKPGVTRDTAIVLLALPDNLKTALVDAGFLTVGQLEDRAQGFNGGRGRLTRIKGVDPKGEHVIENAIYQMPEVPVSTIHDDG